MKNNLLNWAALMAIAILLFGCPSNNNSDTSSDNSEASSDEIVILIDENTRIEGDPNSESGAKIFGKAEILTEGHEFSIDTVKNVVVFQKKDDGPITGTFSCGCELGGHGGGCILNTFPQYITCRESVCKDCAFRIQTPGPVKFTLE